MATRKRAAKKPARRAVTVTESALILVSYNDSGSKETFTIRAEDTGRVFVEAPCGSGCTIPKAVAIAVANAILKVTESL